MIMVYDSVVYIVHGSSDWHFNSAATRFCHSLNSVSSCEGITESPWGVFCYEIGGSPTPTVWLTNVKWCSI